MKRRVKQLKNGRSERIHCDGEHLRSIIVDRGYIPSELAESIGYHESYFSTVFRTNMISKRCVILLRDKASIMPIDYIRDNNKLTYDEIASKMIKAIEPVQLAKSEDTITLKIEVDVKQLTHIIKEAVTDAFNQL